MLITVFTACSVALTQALRWGNHGHYITARLAYERLGSRAKQEVDKILDGWTIEDAATWPDTIRSLPEWTWTAQLHYVNTPDRLCNYNYYRDCVGSEGTTGNCVGGAITNFSNQLDNRRHGAHTNNTFHHNTGLDVDPREALSFLVHMIGDIHQPLHVGFVGDLGGNRITVNWFGRDYNLHSTWDSQIIYKFEDLNTGYGDWQNVVPILSDRIAPGGQWADEVQEWERCESGLVCPDDWSQESVEDACKFAYKDQTGNWLANGARLAEPYYEYVVDAMLREVAKGSVRLAVTLNRIFE